MRQHLSAHTGYQHEQLFRHVYKMLLCSPHAPEHASRVRRGTRTRTLREARSRIPLQRLLQLLRLHAAYLHRCAKAGGRMPGVIMRLCAVLKLLPHALQGRMQGGRMRL